MSVPPRMNPAKSRDSVNEFFEGLLELIRQDKAQGGGAPEVDPLEPGPETGGETDEI